MTDERQTYQAPALERGLEILERLATLGGPATLAEMGRELGRSRSELFRMFVVLERGGYLSRVDGDRYALTSKLYDVALRAPPQRDLIDAALPAMHRTAVRLQQSCHLGVASGTDLVVAARVESPDMLGFSLRVGFRRPLNLSASGRVLYAYQSAGIRMTWRSLANTPEDAERWQEVEAAAQAVLDNGHYITPSFYVDAVTDVVAPIIPEGRSYAVATLVVPFISGQSTRTTLDEVATCVMEEAATIGRGLML
ncbi:IclR family transcriptional regulator [Sphingobium tyrosinilyticum]|uniref:IclR family transcriptional regulator n=1 Tax=Sphingobium tyrosinilyticum TaxID=2715436 RepID=A0ABV9F322_9SPHN